MILFSDVIDQLETAEANLISLVDNKEKRILPDKYNKVITLLNTALSDIFTRFEVRHGSCIIQTTEGKYNYLLDVSNSITTDPVNGFIVDDESSPFEDEVLEVTGVYTIDDHKLPFNTLDRDLVPRDFTKDYSFDIADCRRSFLSPKYKTLRTPLGLRSSLVKLQYKVGHTKIKKIEAIELDSFDPETLVIDLPYVYLVPMVYYIISRLSNARGTERAGQGMFNEGASFFAKYLSECNLIKDSLSQSEQTIENSDNFSQRGFI